MRFGSVRLLAAVLLCCTPAIAMAAPKDKPASTKFSPAKAPTAKAQGKKAKGAQVSKAAKYNAPIYSAIVVDAATGNVLSEVNADTKGYPASLTKMMTLYMLFDALERGQVSGDSLIPVTARAMNAAPSKLNLTRNSKLTVDQAIGALITKSANDVAVATAEFLGGSEDAFAEKMTARARELGMSQTTFMNASGLPNPGQISSARDMAILAGHLIKDHPQYYTQFGRMEYVYQGQTIRTHNRLLEFYEGADGIKTGYTAASGYNLVGSATRNGYRIIGVIFGGATANARDRKLAELMDQGFAVVSGGQAAQPVFAGNTSDRNADRIGTQIALAQPAAAPTEQGDADSAYTPASRSSVSIETTSLPPLPAPTKMAALTSPTSAPSTTPTTDDSASTAGVQIGAFSDRAKAQTQAEAAAAKVKPTFAGATPVVMAVKSGGKMIYRARVMGLGSDDLMQACGLIPAKIKAGPCQAIRPEQVAAN